MSNRYIPEPQTTGKVILKTTHGEIHIELWTKETQKTCKNFIQLCLESYYDNCPFHRIIPGFMVQTGDPTGTGQGGESVYGGPFQDEFHSRLKFSHRGLVAMSNTKKNDNKSQFFITLDKTPWLDRKHTIFGKVGNNTIYNVVKISEVEIGADDRPLICPVILSTEVVVNPFDDIIPREIVKKNATPIISNQINTKKIAKPNQLSFADEEEEEHNALPIRSSHQVLEDPRLSKKEAPIEEVQPAKTQKKEKKIIPVKEDKNESETSDQDFDEKMRKKVLSQKKALSVENPDILKLSFDIGKYKVSTDNSKTIISKQVDPEEEFQDLKSKLLLELKKRPTGSNSLRAQQEIKDEETFLSPLELRRYQFYQKKVKSKGREGEVLGKLNSFLSKIREPSENETWFKNKLKFSVDSTKAYAYKKEPIGSIQRDEEDSEFKADPSKRLKLLKDDNAYGKNIDEDFLSFSNLMKISDPKMYNNK